MSSKYDCAASMLLIWVQFDLVGSLGCEAYLASKLGLQGFAKALQQEAIEDKNFALCRDGKSKV
jgi:hypothetical protein